MQINSFKRANAMLAAINAIITNAPTGMRNYLLGQLNPYKSRGHGRGKVNGSRTYKNRKQTAWQFKTNGQNGKREIARRACQIELGMLKVSAA